MENQLQSEDESYIQSIADTLNEMASRVFECYLPAMRCGKCQIAFATNKAVIRLTLCDEHKDKLSFIHAPESKLAVVNPGA